MNKLFKLCRYQSLPRGRRAVTHPAMSYFEAALEILKEKFEPFRALVVFDDKALRRYVISWGPQLVRRRDD